MNNRHGCHPSAPKRASTLVAVGTGRVLRGASCSNNGQVLRASARYNAAPAWRNTTTAFVVWWVLPHARAGSGCGFARRCEAPPMKLSLAAILSALLLAGCATQPREQLAAVRASGVSASIVSKLEHWGILSPEDIIELRRHHVNDAVALRQLDRVGVNYVVDKSILTQLRTAGVSQPVITALVTASRQFELRFRHPYGPGWHGVWGWGYPYSPYYYDYYELGWPYP